MTVNCQQNEAVFTTMLIQSRQKILIFVCMVISKLWVFVFLHFGELLINQNINTLHFLYFDYPILKVLILFPI